MTKGRKLLAGGFLFLNLTAAVYANRPLWGKTLAELRAQQPQTQGEYYRLYLGWLIENYANRVGLDNRWQMFGHQSRFNWWYRIKATYASGEEVLLPIPGQSERTLLERAFVDFKEAKFALNLYPNRPAREAYAQYLARRFPERNGAKITKITWNLAWQNIRSQEDAAKTGDHLEPRTGEQTMDVFPVGG